MATSDTSSDGNGPDAVRNNVVSFRGRCEVPRQIESIAAPAERYGLCSAPIVLSGEVNVGALMRALASERMSISFDRNTQQFLIAPNLVQS